MLVVGPQRTLFGACVIVGFLSLLSLDLYLAPASLAGGATEDAAAGAAPVIASTPISDAGASAVAMRVVIPAPARVPTILARFDSASTEPSDQSAIRTLATAMIEDHGVSIVLEGHSDTRGGDDYNHTISLERANWVKARLVELGVSPERIETVGLGATRPLRSDDPDAPSSVNRRVEVRWLGSGSRDALRAPKPSARPASSITPTKERSTIADAAAPVTASAAPSAPASTTATIDASRRTSEGAASEPIPRSRDAGGESLQQGDE